MCDGNCGVGLPAQIGRPPKRKKIGTANGYASGNMTDNAEGALKEHFWDASKRGAGITTGYVMASAIQDSVELLRDNAFLASGSQMIVGMAGKHFLINDKSANGFFDNMFSGFIARAGVNMFRAGAAGLAQQWGIKGIGSFKNFRPQMQYKRSA